MSPTTHFSRNRTLFGLLTNQSLVVRYDPSKNPTEWMSDVAIDPFDIEPADVFIFNAPAYVTVAGVKLFPSSYEVEGGVVSYHSTTSIRRRHIGARA